MEDGSEEGAPVLELIEHSVLGKPLVDSLQEPMPVMKRLYSTNHVYLHRPNAFGFWQTRLHLCYETLKRVSNFSELA